MKRILSPWLALAPAFLLAIVLAAAAWAQPSPSTPRTPLDSAKQHMERGQEAYSQKRYAEAADAFAAAYAAEPYAAFLYNEAVCHQKLGHLDKARELLQRYLSADPRAADADQTRARIARIDAALASIPAPVPDGGAPPDTVDAGLDATSDAVPPPSPIADEPADMKSLVIIESEPSGAPVSVYLRASTTAGAFSPTEPSSGWTRVASGATPLSTTLDVGHYHIVIEPFADFHRSETDIDVASGHIHQFKANLRQGEFLAFLRVTSPQLGARIFLDDPPPHKKPPWGNAPYEGLVRVGEHRVWVERAGFQPASRTFVVSHGEQRELLIDLPRVSHGILRIEGNAAEIEVDIDGSPAGVFHTGSPLELDLPGGVHELVARADGRKTLSTTVDVPRGRVLPLDLVMMPKTPRGAAWTQAVLSAAFIGGGSFLGLRANSVYDELRADQRAGTLTDDDDRYTKGKVYAIGADACFGVGGVLALISAYNFVKDPTAPSALRSAPAFDFPDASDDARSPKRHAAPRPSRRPSSSTSAPSSLPHEPDLLVVPLTRPSSAELVLEWRF